MFLKNKKRFYRWGEPQTSTPFNAVKKSAYCFKGVIILYCNAVSKEKCFNMDVKS